MPAVTVPNAQSLSAICVYMHCNFPLDYILPQTLSSTPQRQQQHIHNIQSSPDRQSPDTNVSASQGTSNCESLKWNRPKLQSWSPQGDTNLYQLKEHAKLASYSSFLFKHRELLTSLEQLHNIEMLANNEGYFKFSRKQQMTQATTRMLNTWTWNCRNPQGQQQCPMEHRPVLELDPAPLKVQLSSCSSSN